MKKRVFVLLAVLALLAAACLPALAAGDLDEISRFEVRVELRGDGTADITYTVDWLVLDSTSQGPLEWVKIGIANQEADELTPLTDTVSGLSRMSDGGSYVRVDLDRAYHAGETVHFAFSLHQSYLYTLEEDGTVRYDFTPGWFTDAVTRQLDVYWAHNQAEQSAEYTTRPEGASYGSGVDARREADGALHFSARDVRKDGRMTLHLVYAGEAAFAGGLDPEMQAEDARGSGGDGVEILIVVSILVLALVVWGLLRSFGDGDYWTGGFFVYPHRHHRGPGGPRPGPGPGSGLGGRSSGGGGFTRGGGAGRGGGGCACACASCACACACACAGGGRAGCSAKNFYGAAADARAALEALERMEK